MRKLAVCALMLAFMVGLSQTSAPRLLAQPPKKDKDTKKDTKKSKAGSAAGTIEISEGKDGKFRFTIRNAEGKFLALSGAHASEKDAKAAVEELREVVADAKVTKKAKDKDK
jgi:uncharacterized protein YegP (UPF0339 family)